MADLQTGHINPAQEDLEDRNTAKTQRTSDDEPLRKRRCTGCTDATPVRTPEKDTTDDRHGERAEDVASSSGTSDGGEEESVRGGQTPDALYQHAEESLTKDQRKQLREILDKFETGDLSTSRILKLIEETKVIMDQFTTEIAQGFKSQEEEQNALDRVHRLWTATFVNVDGDGGDLQPTEEDVEEVQSEERRHAAQTAIREEFRQIIRRLQAQIHDGRLVMRCGELREIMLHILRKMKELEEIQTHQTRQHLSSLQLSDFDLLPAEPEPEGEAQSEEYTSIGRQNKIRKIFRKIANRYRAQIHDSSLLSTIDELREIIRQFQDSY